MQQRSPQALFEAHRDRVEARVARFAEALGTRIDLSAGIWDPAARIYGASGLTFQSADHRLTIHADDDVILEYQSRRTPDTPFRVAGDTERRGVALLEAAGHSGEWRLSTSDTDAYWARLHDGRRTAQKGTVKVAATSAALTVIPFRKPQFVRTPPRTIGVAAATRIAESARKQWGYDKLPPRSGDALWAPLSLDLPFYTLVYRFSGPVTRSVSLYGARGLSTPLPVTPQLPLSGPTTWGSYLQIDIDAASGEVIRIGSDFDPRPQSPGFALTPRFKLARLAQADPNADALVQALLCGATHRPTGRLAPGGLRRTVAWGADARADLRLLGDVLLWRERGDSERAVKVAAADLADLRRWLASGR